MSFVFGARPNIAHVLFDRNMSAAEYVILRVHLLPLINHPPQQSPPPSPPPFLDKVTSYLVTEFNHWPNPCRNFENAKTSP